MKPYISFIIYSQDRLPHSNNGLIGVQWMSLSIHGNHYNEAINYEIFIKKPTIMTFL